MNLWIDIHDIIVKTRMTTSISREASKNIKSPKKKDNTENKKNHKWKNGQIELFSRCLLIIKS